MTFDWARAKLNENSASSEVCMQSAKFHCLKKLDNKNATLTKVHLFAK